MQPSLSPPRTYAVYLIDYPDGGYADNPKPYALEIFLLPCGLCDTLALIPLSFEILYILSLIIADACPAYHETVSVDTVWSACHQRADIVLRQDNELGGVLREHSVYLQHHVRHSLIKRVNVERIAALQLV